jgi:ketosteroid isomerase-like protein
MDDAATIRNTITPWRNAITNQDWDALISMCTDDIVFSPPGARQVSGADVKPWLEGFPTIKKVDFSFDRIDISGDLATGAGHGAWTLEINGADVSENIKFLDIFRRRKDGTWRYAHVIWNLDGSGT